MIAACIFDLDGVIVDTARYHFLAWRRLANELGIAFDETENEKLKGVSRIRSLEIILELGKIQISEEEKNILAEKKNGWFVDFLKHMKREEIFPGVKNLLTHLRAAGLKIGLASSSKNAMMVVDLLDIQLDFDTIVDGTMIVNSKPDPEIFLLTAKQLDVSPNRCLVFEDAEAGVAAALSAGMKCIGIGNSKLLSKANRVIDHTGEFPMELLKTL